MIQLYAFFKALYWIYKGNKYLNHKILEHENGVSVFINLYEVQFSLFFSPALCHRHTIALCVAGRGDSIDGVVTWYTMNSHIWTQVGGGRFSPPPTCLDQPLVPPSHVYSGKWPIFLGAQQSGHGADHPSQSSADIMNRYSYTSATSVCCHLHVIEWPLLSTCMWLIGHELRFYVLGQKKSNRQ